MKQETLPDELCPCEHMTNLISRRSDGSLSGPAKWYTDFHVMTCRQCKTALQGLQQMNEQVKQMKSGSQAEALSEADWKEVERKWDAEDTKS
jgi:hypothetical protein